MITKYKDFIKESLSEVLDISIENILQSISATKLNIFNELKLDKGRFTKLDINYLSDSIEFINSLSSLGLKKSEVKNTSDFENFLIKEFEYMLIYQINSNELEEPEYILIQKNTDKISTLYKLNGNINNFYDKLSSRTIEIIDSNTNYIYSTNNGNEWILQNTEEENKKYKKVLRNEKFKKLIDNNVKINII